ncbi:hypothetical protein Bbelb_121700 [Branchiostoma belcheri]|nr:hypothetical protein Bbelb_121700 [Branchiostoma belcheri]
MAAAPLSLGTQIREELSCSICLELFTRPKVLPCQHTFCQDCLQDHVGDKLHFKCPNCCWRYKLPPQGVAGLPDSYIVANMCDKLQQQATLETWGQPQSENWCSFHPTEEVTLYCKLCCVPVCNDCLDEMHSDHGTISLKKAIEQAKAPVQALIVEAGTILETYSSFFKSVWMKGEALDEEKQQTENSINQTYNQMVQKLTENRDHLLSKVINNHQKNVLALANGTATVLAHVDELFVVYLRAVIEMLRGGVKLLDQQSALTDVVGKYREKAAPTPAQTWPAVFHPKPTDTPVPVLGHVTNQTSMYPSNVAMDGEGNLWVVGWTEDDYEFAVQYNKQGRALRKIDLMTVEDERHVAVDTRRNHILITGKDEVLVFRPDGTLVRTVCLMQGMKNPSALTVDIDGNILVLSLFGRDNTCEYCIFMDSEEGQCLHTFDHERSDDDNTEDVLYQFSEDAACNKFVVKWNGCSFVRFDKTGRFRGHIPTDLCLSKPHSVATGPYGQLVLDFDLGRGCHISRKQSWRLHRQIREELSCSICLELFTRPKVLPCQHTFCQDCLQDLMQVGDYPSSAQTVVGSDHGTITLKKVSEERKAPVQALIVEGRTILETYCTSLRSLRDREKALDENKQKTDNSIIQDFEQEVQKVTEKKDHLLFQEEEKYKEKKEALQEERDKVLADVNELSAACDRAEQEMDQGGVGSFSQEAILTEVVGKYRGKAAPTQVQTQPAVFQPTDTPALTLRTVAWLFLLAALLLYRPSYWVYNAAFEQQSVPKTVPKMITFGGFGTEFDLPSGVAVSDEGEIFVADRLNQRIQVFTLQGTFVRQFPTFLSGEQMMKPCDVALDGEGNLWVVGDTYSANADVAVHYNKQGRVLKEFNLQMTWRNRGVAVDTRRNHILITQTKGLFIKHGEVLVFRPDGTLVRTVGQQQGMKEPRYITVDGEGNILVSDLYNDCVYVYNEDGQFLFQFGGRGSGEGKLNYPRGICTDRAGNIIVADEGNRRVEMFDKTVKFIKHIATDIEAPEAVAMATQGQLVVTDSSEDSVHIINTY